MTAAHAEVGQSEQPGHWSDAAWRALVRSTAEVYLSPDFNPRRRRPNMRQLARRAGYTGDDQRAMHKADRYALAAAAISRITDHAVTGTGTDARFRQVMDSRRGDWPPDADRPNKLTSVVMDTFAAASQRALQAQGSHLGYFLRQFQRLDYTMGISTEFMKAGGNMPIELGHFSRVTAHRLGTSAVSQQLDAAGRVAAAHTLIPVVTGRASQHIETLVEVPGWLMRGPRASLQQRTSITRAGEVRQFYKLVQPDGAPLFRLLNEIGRELLTEPLIKCPAHQHLFDAADTALELQLHAGVNLAGDLGVYDLPPPIPLCSPPSVPAPSK